MKLVAVFALLCLLGVITWAEELQDYDLSLKTPHCRHPEYQEWYSVGNMCVKLIDQALNFNEAESHCAGIGKNIHLVSLHCAKDNFSIGRFAREIKDSDFWVGAQIRRGRWKWTDGSNTDYKNLRGTPPSTGRSCIAMHGGGKWDAVNCNMKLNFICEFKE
ncbi:snaclec alboaggregin-D subunit beta-like [Scleropages formosus]|uniref:snaclec alboaggregin-D subunit beta-like n=1 Tax=Scleropages formosus TaxID=113540 RepID=UPI0010FA737E|nr:snaclec alboaggregin-D subunit beta-like [Scleropages formosus]